MRGSRVLIGVPALLARALSTGCGGGGDDGDDGASSSATGSATVVPPPTTPVSSPSSAGAAVVPEGYSAVVIEVEQDDGTTKELCVWLAESSEQHQRGLMAVTSLGGADGMLFRFGAEYTGSFWMKDTVLPLSIAFFAGDGAFVSATDMEPCPPTNETCPLYQADGPYADAIEVVQGDLPSLGIGPGSRLSVTDRSCQPSGP
jgi:uncharacterized membrane protein (UPF0127 family)